MLYSNLDRELSRQERGAVKSTDTHSGRRDWLSGTILVAAEPWRILTGRVEGTSKLRSCEALA